ncbi:MAG: acyltransferase [Bdellovibrionales bacterium]|nr:acyltransferase [Bdellovibrionales bacterium]
MRYRSFDGIRVIATLLVATFHALVIFQVDVRSFRPVVGFFFQTFFFGSGFFIAKILLKNLEVTGRLNIGTFYIRRILRTWPLYFIGITASMQFEPIGPEIWKYLVFIQNFWDIPFYFHSWSVAIEEQFYLFSPLLLLITVRYLTPGRAFLLMLAIVIYLRHRLNVHFSTPSANNTLLWIDGLIFGMYCATPSAERWITFLKRHYLWIQLSFPFFFMTIIKNYKVLGPFYSTMWMFVVTAFFISCLNERSIIGKFLSFEFFQVMTKRTYSIYLSHTFPMTMIVSFGFIDDKLSPLKIGLIAVSMILALALSEVLYRLIEKPILDYRDRRFPDPAKGTSSGEKLI